MKAAAHDLARLAAQADGEDLGHRADPPCGCEACQAHLRQWAAGEAALRALAEASLSPSEPLRALAGVRARIAARGRLPAAVRLPAALHDAWLTQRDVRAALGAALWAAVAALSAWSL